VSSESGIRVVSRESYSIPVRTVQYPSAGVELSGEWRRLSSESCAELESCLSRVVQDRELTVVSSESCMFNTACPVQIYSTMQHNAHVAREEKISVPPPLLPRVSVQ
jgi:hypothetical protein